MRIWEDYANPNWLAKAANTLNPNSISGISSGLFKDLAMSTHEWGRMQFASNYARGGFAATAFAPTTKDAWKGMFRNKIREGSAEHIRNLERLQKLHPESEGIAKALASAKSPITTGKIFKNIAGKALGHAVGIGFLAAPLFTTPGGIDDKLRATAKSAVGFGAFTVGAKVGSATGATIGSLIFPGVGTAIGAVVGGIAGGLGASELAEGAVEFGYRAADSFAASERRKRHLNWINDASAFNTRKAHTMRQQSLSAMNRGMMASRSVLGREAAFMHM